MDTPHATNDDFRPVIPDEAPHTECDPRLGIVPPPWGFWPWTVSVEWSPDGSAILFSRGRWLYAVAADGSRVWEVASGAAGGERRSLLYGDYGGSIGGFDISPDGRRVLFATCAYPRFGFERAGRPARIEDHAYELVLTTLDGRAMQRLTMNAAFDGFPTWSPDGRRIAYLHDFADSFLGRAARLVTMAADGSDARHVLTGSLGVHQPAWSPDGRKLALTAASDDARARIYLLDVDTPRLQLLHELEPLARTRSGPAWSPDGRRLAFVRDGSAAPTIYTVVPDGPDERPGPMTGLRSDVPPDTEPDTWAPAPAWSPDGDRLLYACGRRVCIVALDGTAVGRSPIELETGNVATWSPDGGRIAVAAAPTWETPHLERLYGPALYTMAPDGSDVRVLARFDADGEIRAAGMPSSGG